LFNAKDQLHDAKTIKSCIPTAVSTVSNSDAHSIMGRASDLPQGVVQRIADLARRRRIPGTNKYARVSRQWRDASSSEDAEQLQLLVDLHYMSDEEVTRARSWMAHHGRAVKVLVVSAEGMAPPQQTWFPTVAAALGNLRRLEVDQGHSLLMLAPVLGQLPQLQHLAAAVGTVADPYKHWRPAVIEEVTEGVIDTRYFRPRSPLPDLGRLCPQLTQLRLQMDVEVQSCVFAGDYEGNVIIDKRLPLLLPVTLQHLTLATKELRCRVLLHPDSLTHLVALRQLTLDGLRMDSDGCQAVAQGLTALQQLRVRGPLFAVPRDDPVLLLSPKLVEYTPRVGLAATTAPQLVHLTRLVWQWGGMFEGTVEALAALTGLQELVLEGSMPFGPVADLVQQAAGLPQLRRLQLAAGSESLEEVTASLAQCTQLTSLLLALRTHWGAPYIPVPKQLTGLRRLTVPWKLLQQEAGAWLAPLTALTRLCLDTAHEALLPPEEWPGIGAEAQHQLGPLHQAKAQEVLQQVQGWPPALQQVMVWVDKRLANKGVAHLSWQHTPAAPGSVPFGVFFVEGDRFGSSQVARGWPRPFSPCPHLPGVRELRGQVQAG
jgi:hypothetical protein